MLSKAVDNAGPTLQSVWYSSFSLSANSMFKSLTKLVVVLGQVYKRLPPKNFHLGTSCLCVYSCFIRTYRRYSLTRLAQIHLFNCILSIVITRKKLYVPCMIVRRRDRVRTSLVPSHVTTFQVATHQGFLHQFHNISLTYRTSFPFILLVVRWTSFCHSTDICDLIWKNVIFTKIQIRLCTCSTTLQHNLEPAPYPIHEAFCAHMLELVN